MHRIKLQQVDRGARVSGRVVEVHQLDARTPPEGAEQQAADAPEAVDLGALQDWIADLASHCGTPAKAWP
jgi:hypothetical protein